MADIDLWSLLRRDHEDIDLGLAAMVDPATALDELPRLVDVVTLALSVHSAAESTIAGSLLVHTETAGTTHSLVTGARAAHRRQRHTLDAMLALEVGTSTWYEAAIELRRDIQYHAGRSERALRAVCEKLPLERRRELAREYATTRLRLFANTSPARVAERLDAISLPS